MKILTDLFQIALVCALFASAIFHPLCVIAIMAMTATYYLGEIRTRLVGIAAAIWSLSASIRGKK